LASAGVVVAGRVFASTHRRTPCRWSLGASGYVEAFTEVLCAHGGCPVQRGASWLEHGTGFGCGPTAHAAATGAGHGVSWLWVVVGGSRCGGGRVQGVAGRQLAGNTACGAVRHVPQRGACRAEQQPPAHTAARAGPDAALASVRMIVVRAAAAHACVEQAGFARQQPPHTAIHHDAADGVGYVSVPRCCGWLRDVFGCRLDLERNPSLPEVLQRYIILSHAECQQLLRDVVEHCERM